jgi:hypothetical protein
LIKIAQNTLTATSVYPSPVSTEITHTFISPIFPTQDGKVLGNQGLSPSVLILYDPATDNITRIDGRTLDGPLTKMWILGEKALIPATHIALTAKELVVWSGWSTDTKMLTKCLAVGGAGSVRVEADFWATPPSKLEVTIYRLPDLTAEVTDSITSPSRPLSKTYNVTAGNKRVLCRAIP